MKSILLLSVLVCAWTNHAMAGDSDSADDDETPDYSTSPRVDGDTVADTADTVADEYRDADVKYTPGTADCSKFVTDVMNRSGIDVPRVTTKSIATDLNWRSVSDDDAEPGDAIVSRGHMGVYTGDNDDGSPVGLQMGKHGAGEMTWDSDSQYYRPVQNADFEQRIGEQLQELSSSEEVGDADNIPSSAISDDLDAPAGDDDPAPSEPDSDLGTIGISVTSPPSYSPPPTYTPPPRPYTPSVQRPSYTPPASTCHGACASRAW